MGTATRKTRWSLLQPVLALVVVGMVFGFIAIIVTDISRKLDSLGAAASDDLQWQVAQVEIDYLVLLRTMETTQSDPALADLRAAFDAFESRLAPLRVGRVFGELRADPDFAEPLSALAQAIDAAIPVIDGPDDALLSALPDLTHTYADARDEVRQVTEVGIAHIAGRADGSRISAAGTLQRLGFLTISLLGLMLALLANTWRLYRTARESSVAAERSAARMAAVVETALDGVVITDISGTVRDFNRAAEIILGCSRDAVVGRHVRDTIIFADQMPLPRAEAIRDGMSREPTPPVGPRADGGTFATRTATRLSGEVFPLEVSVTTTRDPDGAALTVFFLRDITHRANADRDLRAARDAALAGERAKQRLLTVMSHEMRTPLNGILATLELLQATQLTEKQAKYLAMIEDSGALLLHHVDDVLDISKMESGSAVGEGRPIDFGAIMHDVAAEMAPLAARNNSRITVTLPDQTRVTGDPIALRRVLMNLVGNSAKFTSDGVIDMSADRLGSGDVVEFCIADTGIGIDPQDHDRIFDDFYTLDASYDRAQAGTGLGLGVVQRLVRQMGGDIGLESEPGEGSLFWVRVPLPPLSSPAMERGETINAIDTNGRPLDVLVVEDNEINRIVVREMLEAAGHVVTEALDGGEGVEQAAARRFDLILMDISMPEMDGVEATRRIRSGGGPCSDTPIIALTANALLHEVSIFRDAGMNETITKPISRRTLDRALVLARDRRLPVDAAQDAKPVAPPAPVAKPAKHTAALDRAQLDTLRTEIGRARADALLARFIIEADAVIADLSRRGPDGIDGTLSEIHKLAGSAAMFGTTRLYERLREFDEMGKTGRAADVPDRLAELHRIWGDTRTLLVAVAGKGTS